MFSQQSDVIDRIKKLTFDNILECCRTYHALWWSFSAINTPNPTLNFAPFNLNMKLAATKLTLLTEE